MKKMRTKVRSGLSIIVGVMICIGSIGILDTKDFVFATNVPVSNHVVKMFYNGDYEKYIKVIDEVKSNNGIELTLNEATLDNSELIISYTIKSDKKLDELPGMIYNEGMVKINGKEGTASCTGGTGRQIDEYTMVEADNYKLDTKELPENFNVNFSMKNVLGVEGEWNFSFELSKKELMKAVKEFRPDIKKSFDDIEITVDKVILTPISTRLYFSKDIKKQSEKLDSPFAYFTRGEYIVLDDKGNKLQFYSSNPIQSDKDEDKYSISEYKYGSLDGETEYLTIIPIINRMGASRELLDENGKIYSEKELKWTKDLLTKANLPIEMEQGEFGKVIVKEVEDKGDETIIKFEVQGEVPAFQAKLVWLEDENEERLHSDSDIEKSKDKSNEFFIKVDKLDPNKKYFIRTTNFANLKYDEKYIIKLPLK